MRALITGINGFAGGHLAEYLVETFDWQVWGLSRSGDLVLPHLCTSVHMVAADLRDRAQTAQALAQARPDVIFHLASQSHVPESFRDPAATLTTNILAQLHLCLTLIDQGLAARMLVIGTNEAYGIVKPADLPIDEATPFNPASPYGVSKVAQDMLALQYHLSHKLDVVRVRPFTHIGPRQSDRFVAAAFAHQIARIECGLQPPILQVGNLSARRDFTDVRDMVRAYVLAVEHGESGQVYNIGSGTAVEVHTLLDLLLAATYKQITITQDASRMRPVDVPEVVCDAGRFFARTGWQPQIAFEQTIRDILEDWRLRVQQEVD